ncbi:MAG: hypothetical protein IPJ28_13790 [Betaproteobacteria bacterium]|nr:hypothetical protein [Betaproteobacteria bacterium]
MSFIITGLENTNEFYSQHYLDEVVERDLKPLFDRWKVEGATSPAARLRTAGGAAYFRARESFLAERKAADRLPLLIDLVQPLLQAIGYQLRTQTLELADTKLQGCRCWPCTATPKLTRCSSSLPLWLRLLLLVTKKHTRCNARLWAPTEGRPGRLGRDAHQGRVRGRHAAALGAACAPRDLAAHRAR